MRDINTALGMVERPLQVGDWVECVDTGGYSWLENASWPKRIVLVGDDDGWVSFEESDEIGEWNPCRFRRVDPPRDDVAELREQLAEVTRERDEARREVNELAELLLQEKNKLASVQAEAAAIRDAFSKRVSLRRCEVSDEWYPQYQKYDLICDQCGWVCNSDVECLTYGDRCPKCEETSPGDEGEMKEINEDD